MLDAQQYDADTALKKNILFAAYSQTGTIEGDNQPPALTLTNSDTALDVDLPARDVQIGGDPVSAAATTVTLDLNESTWPRRDVIWTDTTGTAQVRKGDPEDYEPDRDTDGDFVNDRPARQTYRPPPDDMDDVLRASPPTGTVEATIVVPPWTDAATDLTDDDWQDHRIEVPSTAGAGSHDNLTDVSPNDHHTPPSDQDMIDAAATEFDTLRTINAPPTTIEAAGAVTAGFVRISSGTTAELTETQVYSSSGASQSTIQLALVDSSGTDVYASTALRDTPATPVAGAETLRVEIRNTNASGGADAAGGGHAIIKFQA